MYFQSKNGGLSGSNGADTEHSTNLLQMQDPINEEHFHTFLIKQEFPQFRCLSWTSQDYSILAAAFAFLRREGGVSDIEVPVSIFASWMVIIWAVPKPDDVSPIMSKFSTWEFRSGWIDENILFLTSMLLHITVSSSRRIEYETEWPNRLINEIN